MHRLFIFLVVSFLVSCPALAQTGNQYSFADPVLQGSCLRGEAPNRFLDDTIQSPIVVRHRDTFETFTTFEIYQGDDSLTTGKSNPVGRLAGQYLSGVVVGLGGGVAGLGAGFALAGRCDESLGCALGHLALGIYAGYTVGSSLGVYLAGRSQYGKVSYLGSLAGSLLGTFLLTRFEAPEGPDVTTFDKVAYGALVVSAPVGGAMIGINLARLYRKR